MTHTPLFSLASTEESVEIHVWLRKELRTFNAKLFGEYETKPILSVARVNGEVIGAVGGAVVLDWLSVDVVFLTEEFRGQGLGECLLRQIEDEGRRLGATRAFVDTTSFQAEGFYVKYGYVEWGRFRDFAPGIDRNFLRKNAL